MELYQENSFLEKYSGNHSKTGPWNITIKKDDSYCAHLVCFVRIKMRF